MNPILYVELVTLFVAMALIVVKAVLIHKNFPGLPLSQWFHFDGNSGFVSSDDVKRSHSRKIQNVLTFLIIMLLFFVWILWLLNRV